MTSPVYVILGPGGQGRDVIDALIAAGRTVAGAFDDDNPPLPAGVPLLAGLDSWRSKLAAGVEFMPAMGNPTQRAELAAAIVIGGGRLASAIHPAAVVSPRASVGPGVFLGAGVVVAPEAVIGDLTFLNALCSVDHDCQLGTAVQVSPGVILPGGVHIGDSAFIGAGAVVLPGRHIGAGAVVGAGSVVIHDVPEGVTVAGNPAREIKRS
ncbi:MAG: acetyltransferase [Dehalococcoidia bacterium]|nr:acetyltransferase [Dehalococcoidia bacterium]